MSASDFLIVPDIHSYYKFAVFVAEELRQDARDGLDQEMALNFPKYAYQVVIHKEKLFTDPAQLFSSENNAAAAEPAGARAEVFLRRGEKYYTITASHAVSAEKVYTAKRSNGTESSALFKVISNPSHLTSVESMLGVKGNDLVMIELIMENGATVRDVAKEVEKMAALSKTAEGGASEISDLTSADDLESGQICEVNGKLLQFATNLLGASFKDSFQYFYFVFKDPTV